MPKRKSKQTGVTGGLGLGPASTGWLLAIGVKHQRDLQQLGAVEAYAQLKAHGYPASLNLVYALEAARRGGALQQLSAKDKTQLKAAAAEALKPRCAWSAGDPQMRRYHDQEWGVPVHDDRKHFEFLILEGAQAGLSWRTVLHKRAAYRAAFAGFDPRRVARFTKTQVKSLLKNAGIIRNRLKIEAAITNARAFLAIQKEFGSFDRYVWQFVGGRPIVNRWTTTRELPARTAESDKLSTDLKKRGFRFVGSTIIYAHMQATGLINDHCVDCHRYRTLPRR